MAVEHVDIIDSECHEPKGASSALAHQVMVSDGAGSGSYKYQTAVLNVHLADSYLASTYVASPIAGEIETIYAVMQEDGTWPLLVISAKINNVVVDNSSINFSGVTITGDVKSVTPTSNKTVSAGDVIEITSHGNLVSANITIVIRGNAA